MLRKPRWFKRRRLVAPLCVALCMLASSAIASTASPRERTRPSRQSAPAMPSKTSVRHEIDIAAVASRLQVPVDPLRLGLQGLDQLYERRYADARTLFRELELKYPDQAIGPLGMAMLAQAQMAENLDFSQEAPYQRAYKETVKRADAAVDRKEAVAFNRFVLGTMRGLEGIHQYRHDNMFSAFQVGWSGMRDLEAARALDPQFVDPLLGIGIYNYWRSAMMRQYDFLAGFSDRRAEGIRQMEQARDRGVFSPVLARLALAYTYVKDRQADSAMTACEEILDAYPDNVITLLLAGQLEGRRRNVAQARRHLQHVLEVDPNAVQVYYELGLIELTRGGDIASANRYLSRYVKEDIDNWYRVAGRVRLGDTWYLLGDEARAMELWKWAAKEDPKLKMAQSRLKGYRPRVPGQNAVARSRSTGATHGARPPGIPATKR